MDQPYLSRLRQAVELATSNDELAFHKAELAGAYARFGRLSEAKSVIAEIRGSNPAYLPTLSACALLAEGQVLHFQSLTTTAVRSFRAAEALARSVNRADIASAALAWVAASEFLTGDVATAARHATTSIEQTEAGAFGALARAHLVIADCLSCAGLPQQATYHYVTARDHASRLGDITLQSTVLYNKAAFEVAELSLSRIDEHSSEGQVRHTELSIQSIERLDAAIGLNSLPSLVPLLRAQFSVAADMWHIALALYETCLAQAETQGQGRWMAKFHSERALCLARTGATNAASDACESSLSRIEQCADLDDLAITHARLSSTYEILDAQDKATEHRKASLEFLKSFRAQQRQVQLEIGEQLSRVTAVGRQKE